MSKFEKGQSGNPKGRPKSLTASHLRQAIHEDMPDILNVLIELAKGGDVQAIKLLLERVCPALKPQAVPINLPVHESLVEQGNAIIQATMTGQIPPDIGSQLITALSHQGKLIELEELNKRLERLEQQLERRHEEETSK
jgi:hypothetical protein